MYSIVWTISLILFIIIEVITVDLFTIWFIGGSIIALILSLFHAPLFLQILSFFIVSILSIIYLKPILDKCTKKTKTNIDAIIGEKCLVIEEINNLNETGAVKINGLEWTARVENSNEIIKPNTIVVVKSIEGAKVLVEKELEF